MKQTSFEEAVVGVQSGEMNMLDFILSQEELRNSFLASIKANGKTPKEVTPEEATEWLTEYENESLHKQ